MKKITIITGNQGVGKSKLAREIAEIDGNFAEICSIENYKDYIDEKFENLIIDMEDINQRNISFFEKLIFNDYISFRKPYAKTAEKHKVPNLIITGVFYPVESIVQIYNKVSELRIINL